MYKIGDSVYGNICTIIGAVMRELVRVGYLWQVHSQSKEETVDDKGTIAAEL